LTHLLHTPKPERRCSMRNARLMMLLLAALTIAMFVAEGPVGPF
jgi:hypothetical protein